MRIPSKLPLFALLAVALAAPSALAQTEPLAHNQAPQLIVQAEVHGGTNTNCPLVTPSPAPNPGPLVTAGGCRTHSSAPNVALWAHLVAGGTEVLVSTCNVEFDVRVDAAGEGYTPHHEWTQGTEGTCTRRPCGQTAPGGEHRAFTFYMREVEPAPTERVTTLFCTEALDGTGASHCEMTTPITSPAPHAGRATLADVSSHGAIFPHCELTGVYDTEVVLQNSGEAQSEQRLEVRHQ